MVKVFGINRFTSPDLMLYVLKDADKLFFLPQRRVLEIVVLFRMVCHCGVVCPEESSDGGIK